MHMTNLQGSNGLGFSTPEPGREVKVAAAHRRVASTAALYIHAPLVVEMRHGWQVFLEMSTTLSGGRLEMAEKGGSVIAAATVF